MLSHKLPNFGRTLLLAPVAVLAGILVNSAAPHAALAADPAAFCINQSFYDRISQYYNLAVGFAILAATFMIVLGGYRMVVSVGKAGMIESGKKMIINAIIGLSIAIVSGVILNVLNPRILKQDAPECAGAMQTITKTV